MPRLVGETAEEKVSQSDKTPVQPAQTACRNTSEQIDYQKTKPAHYKMYYLQSYG